MLTQHKFNEVIEQINKAFQRQDQKLEALEAEVQDLKERLLTPPEAKSNARKKTRPKTS